MHDLIMFGVATGEPRRLALDERCESGETRHVLQRLRQVLRRHALTLRLARREKAETIPHDEIIDELRATNRAAQHRARTWYIYADRIARWLHATGLLAPVPGGGWKFQDRGEVHVPKDRRSCTGKFLGDAPPEKVAEALKWLVSNGAQRVEAIKEKGFRNASAVLLRFGLAIPAEESKTYRSEPTVTADRADEVLWDAANKDETVCTIVALLEQRPNSSSRAIAELVGGEAAREWKGASKVRIGNGLRRWAAWVLMGRTTGKKPSSGQALSYRRKKERQQGEKHSLFDTNDDEKTGQD